MRAAFVGAVVGWVEAGFAAGLLISIANAPVGVSGAMFLPVVRAW